MASQAQDHPSVLIAGAGPSGLILALALVQNGVSVRIIEKADSFHLGQRGSGIQPRTIELFQFLGYRETLMKESLYLVPVCMYKVPEGREVAKIVEMSQPLTPSPDVPYRNPVVIGQSHNEALLRDYLAQYGVKVELSTELLSFTQDDEGVNTVILHHTSSGGSTQEEAHVKYIVGAEGARSVVRKQLGLTFLGETPDVLHLFLADVYLKGLSTKYWHQWGDAQTKMYTADVDTHALSGNNEAVYNFIRHVTKHTELEHKAPDSPGLTVVSSNGSRKTSLFEIFKPYRHTILLFGGNIKTTLQALRDVPSSSFYTVLILPKGFTMTNELEALGTDLSVIDSEEYTRTYYPPTKEGFETVVVRPDGVVGAIVKGEEGLKKYLRGIFGI